MRKVDCLSLFRIDFNNPAFTPDRHGILATLDFSENITLFAFSRPHYIVLAWTTQKLLLPGIFGEKAKGSKERS
jgi:hypothetical protein